MVPGGGGGGGARGGWDEDVLVVVDGEVCCGSGGGGGGGAPDKMLEAVVTSGTASFIWIHCLASVAQSTEHKDYNNIVILINRYIL